MSYTYDRLNLYQSSMSPSTVHCRNTELGKYFRKYLFEKAISVFKWELPEDWDEDFFKYVLYGTGYIAIVPTDALGVIPQYCTLNGYNVYYRPKNVLVTNPALKELQGKMFEIGKDCELIKMTTTYTGIADLIGYYADLMALASESVGLNVINSHLAFAFAASNKNQAESFKKIYDEIASGNPAVFFDKNLLTETGEKSWDVFFNNLRNNFITPELMETLQKIESMFDADVGIPNTGAIEKRERLTNDEINANNSATFSKSDLWLENIRRDCEKVKEMFGINISVDYRADERTGTIYEYNGIDSGHVTNESPSLR